MHFARLTFLLLVGCGLLLAGCHHAAHQAAMTDPPAAQAAAERWSAGAGGPLDDPATPAAGVPASADVADPTASLAAAPQRSGEAAPAATLAPPESKENYKARQLAEAMRGLVYTSGRVEVDEAAAAGIPGRGDAAAAEAAYQLGLEQLFQVNDRVAAIAALTRAVVIAPTVPRYYVGLGEALLRKGKSAEALASLRTALDLDPQLVEAQRLLARALAMTGDGAAAIASWNELLQLDPASGEAYARLAILHHYAGDREAALWHAERAESLGQEVPPQFRYLLDEGVPPMAGRGARALVTVGPPVKIDTGGSATANETTMASIDPLGLEVVGGWNDYRQGLYRTGVSVSNNGGASWTDLLLRPPLAYQGSTEGDPMTCYDNRTGTLWAGGMTWASNGGVFVARKNPGANTFQPSVMTIVNGSIDKGWMAAGVDPSNPDATRVYVTYNFGCQRSTDMGSTWSSAVSLGSGIGFLPRVGPGGQLYVCYWDYDDGVMLLRSYNGGVSFGSPITIATRMDVWDIYGHTRFPGTFRVPSLNYLAVDPNSGTLYCIYFDTTNSSGGNYNVDLYFTRSTNEGTSWTTPVVINSDSIPPRDQFWPWLEVDAAGRLHLVFFNSRHTAQNDSDTHGYYDAYYALSEDGGENWAEYRLTPASFDSYFAGGSSQFIGDYLGLGVGGSRVYPCYPATTDGDADIYTNVITLETTPVDTVSATIGCVPGSGIVPFQTTIFVQLDNLYDGYRRMAARINAQLASGTSYSNWRSGFTNLASGESYITSWNQNFPNSPALIGNNLFTLAAEDVTPSPYNQTPYAPAGDTDSSVGTVTGIAP